MITPIPEKDTLWRCVTGAGAGSVQRVIITNPYEIVCVQEFSSFAMLRGGPQWSYLGSVEDFMRDFRYIGGMPAPYSATRKK